MAEIVFLGTSSAVPTKERNHTSIFFKYNADNFLFDCGEGTQRQMSHAKLSMVKLKAIFITHLHGDHIFGLPGLLQTLQLRERKEPLLIFGPKGIKQSIHLIRKFSEVKPDYEIKVKETEKGKLLETEDYVISAFSVEHGMPALGYVFQENKRLHANEKKLKKIGLEPGKEYGLLKEGKTIGWKGKKLKPGDYVTSEPGMKIVYAGDTIPCDAVIKNSEGADMLIHEASFAQDAAEKAKAWDHSTAKDAGQVAREANVKQLVLTHFSTRYKDADLDKLLTDAKKEFENVVIAKDFMRIEI